MGFYAAEAQKGSWWESDTSAYTIRADGSTLRRARCRKRLVRCVGITRPPPSGVLRRVRDIPEVLVSS